MSKVDVQGARKQLLGPIHAALQDARGLCAAGATDQAIDEKLVEADVLTHQAAVMLDAQRGPDIPVEVAHGTVSMRPPLLFSVENPDGVLLEDLFEQLLIELKEKQERHPSREGALVITYLETALLWRQRQDVASGIGEFRVTEPKAAV